MAKGSALPSRDLVTTALVLTAEAVAALIADDADDSSGSNNCWAEQESTQMRACTHGTQMRASRHTIWGRTLADVHVECQDKALE